jgi:hypothetical protein
VLGRNGRQTEYWQTILEDLDAIVGKVEPYRKSLRITFADAGVLMNGQCDAITETEILEVDARLPCMKELGSKGGQAKGESKPAWALDAEKIIQRYIGHSSSRAAELTVASWPRNNSEAPSQRTIRRFITKQRNELAKKHLGK